MCVSTVLWSVLPSPFFFNKKTSSISIMYSLSNKKINNKSREKKKLKSKINCFVDVSEQKRICIHDTVTYCNDGQKNILDGNEKTVEVLSFFMLSFSKFMDWNL